jgi:hypothetical protein
LTALLAFQLLVVHAQAVLVVVFGVIEFPVDHFGKFRLLNDNAIDLFEAVLTGG